MTNSVKSPEAEQESKFLNLSFYCFTPLEKLEELQGDLLRVCINQKIKGLILLAKEGFNVTVVGPPESIELFMEYFELRLDADLSKILIKKSWSGFETYQRMRVRVKNEIIPTGREDIEPKRFTAPNLPPEELRDWYKKKKDFIILDTRNDYEIGLGAFKDAENLDLRNFRDFTQEIEKLPKEYKDKPVVTYCTGGIRCEKASAVMLKAGFNKVYQLEGGILNYFEKCGEDYFDGNCFVFDERVAVQPDLKQHPVASCMKCRNPLPAWETTRLKVNAALSEECPWCLRENAAPILQDDPGAQPQI